MQNNFLKKILIVLLTVLISACGAKLDGTYSNNDTGVAEQKVTFTFKSNGTVRMSVGSTIFPTEVPYEINGKKIKVAGLEGDVIFTILDDGNLLGEGVRWRKEKP